MTYGDRICDEGMVLATVTLNIVAPTGALDGDDELYIALQTEDGSDYVELFGVMLDVSDGSTHLSESTAREVVKKAAWAKLPALDSATDVEKFLAEG